MAESINRDWAPKPNPLPDEDLVMPQHSREELENAILSEHMHPEARAELSRVASNFPRRHDSESAASDTGIQRRDTLEGLKLEDPVFDPRSEEFDQYKWARMMLKLLNKEGFPRPPSTGVVFENLNVSGSGSALQYQKNVGSVLLAPFRPQDYLSFVRRAPEK